MTTSEYMDLIEISTRISQIASDLDEAFETYRPEDWMTAHVLNQKPSIDAYSETDQLLGQAEAMLLDHAEKVREECEELWYLLLNRPEYAKILLSKPPEKISKGKVREMFDNLKYQYTTGNVEDNFNSFIEAVENYLFQK